MAAMACTSVRGRRRGLPETVSACGMKAVRGPVASSLETRHSAGSQRVATAGRAHTRLKLATVIPVEEWAHSGQTRVGWFAGRRRFGD